MPAVEAAYSNYVLTMRLAHSIDPSRFYAEPHNHFAALQARRDMPRPLKELITELFRRKAITQCSITFGRRVDMSLSRTNGRGHLLLSEGALQQFRTTFAQLAGRPIVATYQPSGGRSPGRRSSENDYTGAALALARIFDAVCDGLVVATAVDQLFGDD